MKGTSKISMRVLTVAAAIGLILAACGPAATPTATPTVAGPVATPTPTRVSPATATPTSVARATPTPAATAIAEPYGDLRVLAPNLAGGTFDPILNSQTTNLLMGRLVWDSLIGMNTDGAAVPGIAERWELSPDGKTYTFSIRKGVKFHDGTDLTGEDVKFSIERSYAEGSVSTNAGALRRLVNKVDLVDPYTVAVRLNTVDVEAWNYFFVGGEGLIVPKKYIEAKGADGFRKQPVGSGPWKFVSYRELEKITVEAVNGHWRKTPHFKTLTILVVPEEATTMAMMKVGQADYALNISLTAAKEVEASGLRTVRTRDAFAMTFPFWHDVNNPKAHPFGDVRVRKAMSLAINRQEIADKIYKGFARPATIWGVAPYLYFYDSELLKPDPYDPAEAKRLLTAAGYPGGGFETTIFIIGAQPVVRQAMVEAIAGYWTDIGVKVKLQPTDFSVFRPLYRPEVKPAIFGASATFGQQSMVGMQYLVFGYYTRPHVVGTPSTDELNNLIEQVLATTDPARRKQLATQAAVMARDLYTIPAIVYEDNIGVVGPRVGNVPEYSGFQFLSIAYESVTHAR